MTALPELLRGPVDAGPATRILLEHSTNMFYVHDAEHRLTYVSSQSADLLDCLPEVALRQWTEFLTDHPANAAAVEHTERALSTGIAQPPYLIQLRTARGRIIWVEVRETPIVEHGVVLGVLGALSDVTHHVRAQEALRRHAAFESAVASIARRLLGPDDIRAVLDACLEDLGEATEASRTYLFELDDDAQTMSNTFEWCASGVSPAKERLRGIPYAELPWWMSQLRARSQVVVPDVAALPPEAAAERAILEEQGIRSLIVFGIRARGELIGFVGLDNVESVGAWSDMHGQMLRVVASAFADAFERSRSLERLAAAADYAQKLIESNLDPLITVDAAGRIVDGNGALERATGRSRAQLRGLPVRDLFAGDGIDRVLAAALLEGVARDELLVMRTGDDAGAHTLVEAASMRAGPGQPARILLSSRDVTARLRRQQEAEAARQAAARNERLQTLGTLVAGVAHEINNPLTYIIGNLELAILDIDEHKAALDGGNAPRSSLGEVRDRMTTAAAGAAAIERITRSLRVVARDRAVTREAAPVSRILAGVERLVVEGGAGTPVRVRFVDEASSARVLADVPALQQVLLNLVRNAEQAIGQRSGDVLVRAHLDGEEVVLAVTDDGPGIPANVLPRVFSPFFTTKPEGTGLGLSMGQAIARDHEGALLVASTSPAGTTFELRLPRARA